MKCRCLIATTLVAALLAFSSRSAAQGPLDPVRLGTWIVSGGIGPGTPFFGNGAGFGPGLKGTFEAGMWDVGPGVITLGGEADFTFFSHKFGQNWRESWFNIFLAARGAYHYGWDVEGLDTYGGIPLGIGFSVHSFDDKPGNAGATPVFPYGGIFFGASYYFNKTFGVNGEVGYNATYANIGIVYRIK